MEGVFPATSAAGSEPAGTADGDNESALAAGFRLAKERVHLRKAERDAELGAEVQRVNRLHLALHTQHEMLVAK